jgi:hypothetical protein
MCIDFGIHRHESDSVKWEEMGAEKKKKKSGNQ